MGLTDNNMGACKLAWRSTEALLGAGVHAVHAPGISKEGNASQAAHRVHHQQRVMLVAQLPESCQALVHAGAALPLYTAASSVLNCTTDCLMQFFHHQQCVMLVAQIPQSCQALLRAGAALPLYTAANSVLNCTPDCLMQYFYHQQGAMRVAQLPKSC